MPDLSRRQVEITNALGLHMRAASLFVQLSQQFRVEVRVSCNGRAANGRSIMDLLTLVAEHGARLELEAIGPDAEEATAALCSLIEARFYEGGDGRTMRPDS
jgi:phosphocarrier protein HPr